MKKIVSGLMSIVLIVLFSSNAFALNNGSENYSEVNVAEAANQIIGQSDVVPETRVPNKLNINWVASSTQVIISVKNIGIDTVDKFAGTVAISGGESKSFSAVNLKPLTTRQITVNINMKKCYENITVSYYATDGGKDFGSGSSPGHREIPSNLSSLWGQGSSASVYAAIEYHFGKHGREVAASDIVTYATKAKTYRDQVISDLAIYSNATLSTIYKITVSTNPTPGHKYKHLTNNQYIILSDSGRKILSYGI